MLNPQKAYVNSELLEHRIQEEGIELVANQFDKEESNSSKKPGCNIANFAVGNFVNSTGSISVGWKATGFVFHHRHHPLFGIFFLTVQKVITRQSC